MRLRRAFWGAAAALPVVIRAALLVASGHLGDWAHLSLRARTQINVDALLLESLVIVIGAPLVGVASVRRSIPPGGGASAAWQCGFVAAIFAVSAALASFVLDPSVPAAMLIPLHLTLGIAALAVSAVGTAAASGFDHPLDAAALALLVSLTFGCGALVAGPLVADAPAGIVNAALVASPIVATASAANIDVLRGDLLYRFSPIAHSRFEYPAWPTACLFFAVVAAISFAFVVVRSNRTGRVIPAERITI